MDGWVKQMWSLHTMYNSALKKREGNSAICDNMDEPGGHYAKSNKQDKEKQILHDVTSCKDGHNKGQKRYGPNTSRKY